jgi:hypothetical protein
MKRPLVILASILLVLGLIAIIVLQQPGEKSSSGFLGEKLVTYDSSAVDRLEIVSPSGRTVLSREGGKWMLKSPVEYRADEAAVTAAIGQGKSIELKSLVSDNPVKQGVFQVDSTGTMVRVFEHDTERAAFHVGKMSSSYTESYVRREGSNDVYLAEGILSYAFGRSAKEWRDKTVFKADRSSITSVRFQYGDTTFTLTQQDSLWLIGSDRATDNAVSALLGALTNFQTDDFIDSAVTLGPPAALIETGGTQIQFYANKEGNKYTVKTSISGQLFDVQSWKASQLLKRKKDFLSSAG